MVYGLRQQTQSSYKLNLNLLSSVEFSTLTEVGKGVNNMKIEHIRQLVEESKKFPNSFIEYSGELPDHPLIKKDKFFGIKAVYNKNVPKSKGCNLIFKY